MRSFPQEVVHWREPERPPTAYKIALGMPSRLESSFHARPCIFHLTDDQTPPLFNKHIQTTVKQHNSHLQQAGLALIGTPNDACIQFIVLLIISQNMQQSKWL